ncbi:UNVERIFIED_CONTAM: hypothetical protein HDU68_012092 [Siphonaria sp. JEL0065]|nr:hypothetical protein HDU68_012092 [Siphonaria sp. JEL0065]
MFEPPHFPLDPIEPAYEVEIFKGFRKADGLGPLLRFVDMKDGVWQGTLLVMLPAGTSPKPIQITTGTASEPVLIDSFGAQTFYRYSISLPLREKGQSVQYAVQAATKKYEYYFHVPALSENSHFAFWSCNGFDCDQKEPEKFGGVSPLWNDLLRHHSEKPFHVQIGGGDQLYMDGSVNVWDLPVLKQFLETEDIKERRLVEWSLQHEKEVSSCYFRAYTSHFQTEGMRDAFASIPYTFVCDDHDIFDGFGSYPEHQRLSHVHLNIGRIAFRFYLLFQHHTTFDLAARDHLFPENKGYNWIKQIGPSTLTVAFDVRSRRTEKQIVPQECWDAVFDALNKRLDQTPSIKHLVVVATVPVSYPRLELADEIVEVVEEVEVGFRGLFRSFMGLLEYLRKSIVGGPKETDLESAVEHAVLGGTGRTSVAAQLLGHFGQPELRDDLIDEWTHPNHASMEERNHMVSRLQELAAQRRVRVTFTSGDVHICGMGRFRSQVEGNNFSDLYGNDVVRDHRAMYQIISSAIGNAPGPEGVIAFLHTNSRVLSPSTTGLPDTVEEMFELFQHDVDFSEKSHKRLMARRNWCSIKYNPIDDSLNAELHIENTNFAEPSVAYGVRIPRLL